MRCRGRKKMYKVRSIYSHTNTGGVEVDCPMCLGVGKIEPAEEALKKINEQEKISETVNDKGINDGEEIREEKSPTKKRIANGKRKAKA